MDERRASKVRVHSSCVADMSKCGLNHNVRVKPQCKISQKILPLLVSFRFYLKMTKKYALTYKINDLLQKNLSKTKDLKAFNSQSFLKALESIPSFQTKEFIEIAKGFGTLFKTTY